MPDDAINDQGVNLDDETRSEDEYAREAVTRPSNRTTHPAPTEKRATQAESSEGRDGSD